MLKVNNSNEHCTSESAHNTVHTYTVRIYRSNFSKGNYEIALNKYKQPEKIRFQTYALLVILLKIIAVMTHLTYFEYVEPLVIVTSMFLQNVSVKGMQLIYCNQVLSLRGTA